MPSPREQSPRALQSKAFLHAWRLTLTISVLLRNTPFVFLNTNRHTHRESQLQRAGSCEMCEEKQPARWVTMKAGALASQQTPWKRKAFKPHSRFYSSPGFTLHRFSQHFKGSIFVQPREECKLASCFQRRDINPERAAGLTGEVERRTRSWGAKRESPHSARPALSAHTKGTALKPLQKGRATVPLSTQTASYKYPPRLEVQRIQQLALEWKLQLTEQASFSLSLPEPRKELKGPKASTTKPVPKSPTTSGWVARGELPLSSILATEPFLTVP